MRKDSRNGAVRICAGSFAIMALLWLLLGTGLPALAADTETSQAVEPQGESGNGTDRLSEDYGRLVYVIPIEQTIETGLERFLSRAFDEAERHQASRIILRINTLGGSVDAALGIGERIRTSDVPTIAYIEGKALSAGSYIALNADQIVMGVGSTIGAAAVVDLAGNRIEDSKIVSSWVSAMTAAAKLNGRNPEYAAGMVDDQRTVHVAEIDRTFGPGELISFDHDDAVKAGYAEAVARNLDEVVRWTGIERPEVVEVEPTAAEKLARFLTNPYVMTLLLLVGLGGIVFELFAPGFGVPGIVGLISIGLYFFGNYVAGFAGVEHIILFVAGVGLLIAELFVPSFGILGIAGFVSLGAGIVLAAYDYRDAMAALGIALLGCVLVLIVVFVWFRRRGVWNRFVLRDEFKTEAGYVSAPVRRQLVGKRGEALTPLRPSGTALIEGERVDVVTSGEFIPAGEAIEVIQVEGVRVVVRKAEKTG